MQVGWNRAKPDGRNDSNQRLDSDAPKAARQARVKVKLLNMNITGNLKSVATSLAGRLLALCFGIALFLFLGPTILASFTNPMIWFDALIAAYFFVAGILAIVFFFSRKFFSFYHSSGAWLFSNRIAMAVALIISLDDNILLG